MKSRSYILLTVGIIFIVITSQSCIIVNATKGMDDICSVHGIKMMKTVVKTQYGFVAAPNNINSPNAKRELPMGCVVPMWPTRRLAKVYHCTKCDEVNLSNKASN